MLVWLPPREGADEVACYAACFRLCEAVNLIVQALTRKPKKA